jgi:hypothetical protein
MKKTIFALFVLLLLLMVTCVYQKTSIIYSNSAEKHIIPADIIETDTLIASKVSAKTLIIPVKEKIIVATTVEKKIEVKAAVESEEPASADTEKNIPEPVVTQSNEKESEKEEVVEEQTLLSKLKAAVMKRLRTSDQKAEEKFLEESKAPAQESHASIENTPAVIEKVPVVIETIALTVTYNTSEEEIVDHLVEALRNQDLAFKNRDKFMLEIEAVIKRALEDRFIAIENRKKAQQVLLEERDIVSKNIPQTYTIIPGE